MEMPCLFVSLNHMTSGGHQARLVMFGVTFHLLRIVGESLGFFEQGSQERPWVSCHGDPSRCPHHPALSSRCSHRPVSALRQGDHGLWSSSLDIPLPFPQGPPHLPGKHCTGGGAGAQCPH